MLAKSTADDMTWVADGGVNGGGRCTPAAASKDVGGNSNFRVASFLNNTHIRSHSSVVMERTAELYGMPTCPVLGSYGGGDAMMLARQLVVEARAASLLPPSLR